MSHKPSSFKIPESVLVVIHTPALDVLLIKRADSASIGSQLPAARTSASESFAADSAT
jgi:dATP pyrophosphohydrolase